MSDAPVLLVHSGGFTARQWRKLSERLASTHAVLAPDLIGYGASGPWPVGAPFHFRQDVDALAARLASLAGPAHVVGHSYGGLLALQLALAHPSQVRSLALYEPVAFGILDEPEGLDADARAGLAGVDTHYRVDQPVADDRWLGQFVDWWNGAGAWDALAEDTKASFRAVGWKLFQEVASLMADTTDRARYGTIAAPTLVLSGARSPMPERRVCEKLAAALPRASLQVFAEMGHMGPITHAARVNDAIVAHLETVDRA
jgi:pimeloyl-ACP methyl ester carboxylesterase